MTVRYIMIGGFLGAGKTTAVGRLAEHLTERGLRVGLITNDQSTGLVDTALLRSHGYPVEEIAGGCFCCRFPSLQDAAEKLTEETRPDVFIAEPVGSCTDLVATVSYPLRRIYGDRYQVAPLSVLVDPHRAARVLGLEEGRAFSAKVRYVYEKQLEEARYLVINKCDELDSALEEKLATALSERYPRADVFRVSAREGQNLEPWFAAIDANDAEDGPPLDIDYDRYAEGEAELGWLNATVAIDADEPLEPNEFLSALATEMRRRLLEEEIEIAHLKMTLDAGDAAGEIAVVSVVRNEERPELRESMAAAPRQATVIVNLRAEAAPERLRDIVVEALRAPAEGVRTGIQHEESFRPARPVPTHRITDAT